MEKNLKELHPDSSMFLFEDNGLRIEAFGSIDGPYVKVSYEEHLSTYSCYNVMKAIVLAKTLVNEYKNKIKSIEDLFDAL
ncbi:hypothetical protein [Carnobacterium mobile]|uniref:hypothetical protein n=1 Tax=Carnobacterium mobile TaxID=2750 RepID=UPI00055182C9|nr:hypothetical protein [Carnobacterium mobile]